jgi:hypothetical protein
VTHYAGLHRELVCPAVAREGESPVLEFRGQPGDHVILVHSVGARFEHYPPFLGVVLYGLGSRRFSMGIVPGTGVLTVPLTIPELGPGVDDRLRHMQALFVDTAGQVTLGSPAELVLLDAAF